MLREISTVIFLYLWQKTTVLYMCRSIYHLFYKSTPWYGLINNVPRMYDFHNKGTCIVSFLRYALFHDCFSIVIVPPEKTPKTTPDINMQPFYHHFLKIWCIYESSFIDTIFYRKMWLFPHSQTGLFLFLERNKNSRV